MSAGRFSADSREVVIDRCATQLGVSAAALMASLFADLPSERTQCRRLRSIPATWSCAQTSPSLRDFSRALTP
jgi:hypothetical protein